MFNELDELKAFYYVLLYGGVARNHPLAPAGIYESSEHATMFFKFTGCFRTNQVKCFQPGARQ